MMEVKGRALDAAVVRWQMNGGPKEQDTTERTVKRVSEGMVPHGKEG
jgi:hypothetical protein